MTSIELLSSRCTVRRLCYLAEPGALSQSLVLSGTMWLTYTRLSRRFVVYQPMDDPRDCILARGRVCVGTIWEKGGEIKTAKFQV